MLLKIFSETRDILSIFEAELNLPDAYKRKECAVPKRIAVINKLKALKNDITF